MNLIYIGHFRDQALAHKFEFEFNKLEIIHLIKTTSELTENERYSLEQGGHYRENSYFLFTDPAQREKAMEIYLVVVGLGAPMKPSKADEEWINVSEMPVGPIGKFSIILSIILFMAYQSEQYRDVVKAYLMISSGEGLLPEVMGGEVWRLITPIFLHFSFMHILFNCMWMREMSKILEDYYSQNKFILYFLIIAITSNLAQYVIKGPLFGGLSGVVYGLLGLLWGKKTLDGDFPFTLPKRDIYLMIGWFFLCLTGLLGPIANTAHGIGLAVGMLIAFVDTRDKISSSKLSFKWLSYIFIIVFTTMLAEVAWKVVQKQDFYFKTFM